VPQPYSLKSSIQRFPNLGGAECRTTNPIGSIDVSCE
jgi:hypothetical protein